MVSQGKKQVQTVVILYDGILFIKKMSVTEHH